MRFTTERLMHERLQSAPLECEAGQTSLSVVAKLGTVISMGAMIPVEINFQISMIAAEQIPVDEG